MTTETADLLRTIASLSAQARDAQDKLRLIMANWRDDDVLPDRLLAALVAAKGAL